MSYPYLDQLPLSEDERSKVVTLAASTPAALLAMINASPQAFHQFLGTQKTNQLAASLEEMLDAHQRALLDSPMPPSPATGAIIGRTVPLLNEPEYSIVERDRLFAELQDLRCQTNPLPQTKERVQQLEAQLNAMLETA